MEIEKITKVLYHKNCHDGLASAGIFYNINKKINYYEYQHGDIVPEFINEVILIVDICLPKKILLNLMKYNIIYIVDHHLPTEEIICLINAPHFIHYDKTKCGALNLWGLLYPDEDIPIILEYVNDRDLWLNKLSNHQEIFDGLSLEEKSVENWYNLIFQLSTIKFQNILENGSIIRKKINNNLKYLENKAYIKNYEYNNKFFKVVYCNSSLYQSDLGNYLLKKFNADFSAIYHYNGNKTIFSLRGHDKVNLSNIAKLYGGGGHYNAAGFSLDSITDKII